MISQEPVRDFNLSDELLSRSRQLHEVISVVWDEVTIMEDEVIVRVSLSRLENISGYTV